MTMISIVLVVLVVIANVCSGADLDEAVLKKLQDLERRLQDQERMNANQQQIIQEHQQLIMKQAVVIKQQQQQIKRLEYEYNQQKDVVATFKDRLVEQHLNRCEDCKNDTPKTTDSNQTLVRSILPPNRVSRQSERIAFSAYLDHNVEHLGIDHPIVYNQVLLNEGSAYSQHSGIFTCPMEGLYVFYFSVSTNGVHQAVAKLVKDAVNQVDAISDTFHQYHEAQGANFVVLSLNKGQQVWIANYRWTDKSVQDSDASRFSTFSGFLLY